MHNVIRMKKFLAVLTLLAFGPVLWAQDGKLNVNADFLTRGEIRDGGLPVEEEGVQDFAAFILERTMIGLDYTKAGFSNKVTAQHSGTWGSSEGGVFNVYEAWVQMTSAKGFFFRLGRQNLSYDDQRVFGSDDWAMTARSHDALKFGYEGSGLPAEFARMGQAVRIESNEKVDSLNLAVAAAIGIYTFSRKPAGGGTV